MGYLLLLVFLVPAYCSFIGNPNPGPFPNISKMTMNDILFHLEQLSWKSKVQEVKKTNSLAQVLQEYLHDIELVEAASASSCSALHRDLLSRAQSTLGDAMDFCVGDTVLSKSKQNLKKCVEDRTKTTVSDTRNHIIQLKNCLDSS